MIFYPGRRPCRYGDPLNVDVTGDSDSCADGTYQLDYDPAITYTVSGTPTTAPGFVWSGTLCGTAARLIVANTGVCGNAANSWGSWAAVLEYGGAVSGQQSSGAGCDPTSAGWSPFGDPRVTHPSLTAGTLFLTLYF